MKKKKLQNLKKTELQTNVSKILSQKLKKLKLLQLEKQKLQEKTAAKVKKTAAEEKEDIKENPASKLQRKKLLIKYSENIKVKKYSPDQEVGNITSIKNSNKTYIDAEQKE